MLHLLSFISITPPHVPERSQPSWHPSRKEQSSGPERTMLWPPSRCVVLRFVFCTHLLERVASLLHRTKGLGTGSHAHGTRCALSFLLFSPLSFCHSFLLEVPNTSLRRYLIEDGYYNRGLCGTRWRYEAQDILELGCLREQGAPSQPSPFFR